MEALNFLKNWKRMCVSLHDCEDCDTDVRAYCNSLGTGDGLDDWNSYERAIQAVEQWAKEHPQKTLAQDFFEKYPNATKDVDGSPVVSMMMMGIEEAPPIDPETLPIVQELRKKLAECEPVRAHWIPRDFDTAWDANRYECSKCGRSIHTIPVIYANETKQVYKQFPYCHCGAKMDEEA